MHAAPRLFAVAASLLLAVPLAAQGGRVSVGPLVGSGPGADLDGARVPTVGVVGDVGVLGMGALGVHVGGTFEYRAGARMTGVSAGARLALSDRVALRAGAATGGAEVRRSGGLEQLGWRDWRGVDAGVELHLGRTTGALMVRAGTIDRFAPACPADANCLLVVPAPAAGRARFARVSFESRYALF